MNKVRLYRIGSDPEFVLGRTKEWNTTVVPAHEIITGGRTQALSSYIGTDGHTSTAELRPPPAHNIRRHLMDIAVALDSVGLVVAARQQKYKGLDLFATPVLGGETQGGHIHVSAFLNNPGAKAAAIRNMLYYGRDFIMVNEPGAHPGGTPLRSDEQRDIGDYCILASQDLLFTYNTFAIAMNYLLQPFEYWIQPWYVRRSRNGSYGGSETEVRYTLQAPPAMPAFREWAYYLFEYRLPSTWLVHPWLAYVYLGLTKLIMLNFNKVLPLALRGKLPQTTTEPGNDLFREEFRARYALVVKAGCQFTNDIKQLEEAIEACATGRQVWFTPGTPIQLEAWRKLI